MALEVRLHPHAVDRLPERGALEDEVIRTVQEGESFPAKYGRTGFRRNFAYGGLWRGRRYETKQIEAYAVWEDGRLQLIGYVGAVNGMTMVRVHGSGEDPEALGQSLAQEAIAEGAAEILDYV